MDFIKHWNLEGKHAPFSPSNPAWLKYDDEKALSVYESMQAKKRGVELHAWAKDTIDLKIKQKNSRQTLCSYINDAIGYRMTPEVVLKYSDRFWGTADAILYDERKKILRIHDLKTGKTKTHMEQLFLYAALFCLEYKVKPGDIYIECRIYQNDDILVATPTAEDIVPIMDKIIHLDKILVNRYGEVL